MTPTFVPRAIMSTVLSSARPVAFVPSTDLDRSRQFYEQAPGLPVRDGDNFAVVVQASGVTVRTTNVGADLHVPPFTVLGREVSDVPAEVADLTSCGVTLLRVDGVEQDEAGVWTAPEGTGSPGSRTRTETRSPCPTAEARRRGRLRGPVATNRCLCAP